MNTGASIALAAAGGALLTAWYRGRSARAGPPTIRRDAEAPAGTVHGAAKRSSALAHMSDAHGANDHQRPFIIGVCGASGSGKTTVCTAIVESLEEKGQRVAVIPSDAYYKGLDGRDPTAYNFDVPAALDFDLLSLHLQGLKRGEFIEMPVYDFKTHSRVSETVPIGNVDVIIVEGILIFTHDDLLRMFDMRLFALEDPDTCLVRRLRRDIVDRGRSVESVLHQYETFVKPAYQMFVQPSMAHADVILPRAGRNSVALKLLLREIRARCVEPDILTRPLDE